MSAVRVARAHLALAGGSRRGGERKVVLRLGDALDREGAPDALERVAVHLREVGPSGAKAWAAARNVAANRRERSPIRKRTHFCS